MASYDPEVGLLTGDKNYAFEFAEREVRAGFIRKVLGILGLQLLFTAGVTALFVLCDPVRHYVYATQWPFWVAFGLSIALIVALTCSEDLRRRHPYNLLTLGAFTACEAVLVGTISAAYDTKVVLLAIGMTACVVLACAAFAMQTKVDLTLSSGALVGLSMALLSAFVLNLFIRTKWMYVTICVIGVVLFSLYLMFDLQLLMGGNRYSLSADEYIFASLNLYLDIINIFLYILQLLGRSND